MPDYGASPDLLEMRARIAASRGIKRGSLDRLGMSGLRKRREARLVGEAYRELFYPHGALHPAGAIVLDDLAEQAGFGAASFDLDHGEMCVTEGKRRLLLFVLARLKAPLTLTDEMEISR